MYWAKIKRLHVISDYPFEKYRQNICVLFNFPNDQSFIYAMALSVFVYRCSNETCDTSSKRGVFFYFSYETLKLAENVHVGFFHSSSRKRKQ